jgi:biotin carboxyl carrier protein
MRYVTTIGEEQYAIDINQDNQITVNGVTVEINFQQMPDTTMHSIIVDGKSHDVRMDEGDGVYIVQLSGEIFEVMVEDERTRRLAGVRSSLDVTGEAIIKAPMPGVVVELLVTPGQAVEQGDILAILESMKMQNEFKAPRAGQVHAVRVRAGDKVDQGAIMVTIA